MALVVVKFAIQHAGHADEFSPVDGAEEVIVVRARPREHVLRVLVGPEPSEDRDGRSAVVLVRQFAYVRARNGLVWAKKVVAGE